MAELAGTAGQICKAAAKNNNLEALSTASVMIDSYLSTATLVNGKTAPTQNAGKREDTDMSIMGAALAFAALAL